LRDKWYSDHRDLVKWATLVHLAQLSQIDSVIQVAFYESDHAKLKLTVSNTDVPFPSEVLSHFRNLENVKRLGRLARLTIRIFKEPFCDVLKGTDKREVRRRYFERAMSVANAFRPKPIIFFLDPDTGMAPKNFSRKHITAEEMGDVFRDLKRGDWLVFYQHARRASGWRMSTGVAFARSIGMKRREILVCHCEDVARDVVFFAARKK